MVKRVPRRNTQIRDVFMTRAARSYRLFVVFLLTGCQLLSAPDTGGLTVDASAAMLALENNSSRTLFYFVIEGGLAIRANWAPCTDPAHCPQIAAHRRVTRPYEAIAGYTPEATTAIAYWWYLEKQRDGSYKPDRIRAVAVDL